MTYYKHDKYIPRKKVELDVPKNEKDAFDNEIVTKSELVEYYEDAISNHTKKEKESPLEYTQSSLIDKDVILNRKFIMDEAWQKQFLP